MTEELALQVLTLAVLASKGIKIARLSGNRNFDEKVVKAKMKSMKANGMLVPAIILDAMKVIEAGLEIVDFETGEIISAADASPVRCVSGCKPPLQSSSKSSGS